MYQINADEFNKAVQQKLTKIEVDFPLDNDLMAFMIKALDYASTLTLGIKGSDMRRIEERAVSRKPINYFDYAILSNNLEMRTKIEMRDMLRGTIYSYYDVMEMLEKNAELMNVKAKVIHEETMREFVTKNSREISGQEQFNPRTANGLKPIKE